MNKTKIILVSLVLMVALSAGVAVSLNGATGDECDICWGIPDTGRDYCGPDGFMSDFGDYNYHRCVDDICHSKYYVICAIPIGDGAEIYHRVDIDVHASGCCSDDPWSFWQ